LEPAPSPEPQGPRSSQDRRLEERADFSVQLHIHLLDTVWSHKSAPEGTVFGVHKARTEFSSASL
jgi:hypothetical protein